LECQSDCLPHLDVRSTSRPQRNTERNPDVMPDHTRNTRSHCHNDESAWVYEYTFMPAEYMVSAKNMGAGMMESVAKTLEKLAALVLKLNMSYFHVYKCKALGTSFQQPSPSLPQWLGGGNSSVYSPLPILPSFQSLTKASTFFVMLSTLKPK
jgi:hypothetical protein